MKCYFIVWSNNGQTNIAEANGLMPFEVRVLEPIRTLCEKIISLLCRNDLIINRNSLNGTIYYKIIVLGAVLNA
jgi:hypothetical protein